MMVCANKRQSLNFGGVGTPYMRGTALGLRPKIKTQAYTSIHKEKEIHIKSGMSMLSGNVFSACAPY